MYSEWLEFHLIPLHCWASFPVVLQLNTVCPFSLFLIWLFDSPSGYTMFTFICTMPLYGVCPETEAVKGKCSQMNTNFTAIAVSASDSRFLSLPHTQGNTGCQSLTDQLIDQSIYFAILQKSLELPVMTEGGRKLCEPQLNYTCLGPEATLGQSCAEIRSISWFSVASSRSHMKPRAFWAD